MTCRTRLAWADVCLIAFLASASTVSAANTAPKISGTPAPSVYEGFRYRFVPTATDADRDRLRFFIRNKPAWAAFDPASGRLVGTPERPGLFEDIRILVSDGSATRSLPPFSIRVRWNHRPRIWGTPATRASVGSWYAFQPKARDRD